MRTEEKPMIARDESLRAAAASLHAAADALLAALSPAPVPAATVPTPAYPVDDKGRPLWVRFTGKWAINSVTPRKVESWPTDSTPRVRSLVDPQRLITLPPDGWEPCAAPTDAVTPAAALTEEDVESLKRDVRAALSAWRKDMADHRLADEVAITSVVAWFAKRGGAK